MSAIKSALWYAARLNFCVGPTAPGTKIPAKIPHLGCVRGHLDATTEPGMIKQRFAAVPGAGVYISCAASGIVVIDVDAYKADCGFNDLVRKLGPLPTTPLVYTQRGGQHYYFKDTVGHYRNPCPGVETKSNGYVLAPATPGYAWELGQHISDTPLAELPDAWLRHLTGPDGRVSRDTGPSLASTGIDARESWLGFAFEAMGWLGDVHHDGRRNVRCPWVASHTDGRGDGRDSSTVLFPRALGRTLGSFNCEHAHCKGFRTVRDVVGAMSPKAVWAADQVMRRERNRLAYEQLDARRRSA